MRTRDYAIETRIDVSGAGHFKRREAVEMCRSRHDLLRDNLGRLAQLARQFEGDGSGQFAESQIRRSLHGNVWEFKVVLDFEHARRCVSSLFFNSRYTGKASEILDFQGRFYHLRCGQCSRDGIGFLTHFAIEGERGGARAPVVLAPALARLLTHLATSCL